MEKKRLKEEQTTNLPSRPFYKQTQVFSSLSNPLIGCLRRREENAHTYTHAKSQNDKYKKEEESKRKQRHTFTSTQTLTQ